MADKDKGNGFFSTKSEIERFGEEYGYGAADIDTGNSSRDTESGSSSGGGSSSRDISGIALVLTIIGGLGVVVGGIASIADSDMIMFFLMSLLLLVFGIVGLTRGT